MTVDLQRPEPLQIAIELHNAIATFEMSMALLSAAPLLISGLALGLFLMIPGGSMSLDTLGQIPSN